MSFALGAALPLVPFLLGAGLARGTALAAAVALTALFLIGMTLSLFTGRSAWYGALRMAAIGLGAGVATFAIGRLLGGAAG